MAKKEEGPKLVLERTYNVPLRREWLKAPKWKRTKKAVKALREFLQRHMKSDNVKLGRYVNESIWQHGGKNPPHHVKVIAKKDDTGVVNAELEGAPVEAKEEEKEVKKGKKPVKEEKKPEEKKEEAKKEEKEEKPEEKEKVVVEEPEKKDKPAPKEEKPKEKVVEKEPKKEKKPADVEEVEKLAKEIVRKESLKK